MYSALYCLDWQRACVYCTQKVVNFETVSCIRMHRLDRDRRMTDTSALSSEKTSHDDSDCNVSEKGARHRDVPTGWPAVVKRLGRRIERADTYMLRCNGNTYIYFEIFVFRTWKWQQRWECNHCLTICCTEMCLNIILPQLSWSPKWSFSKLKLLSGFLFFSKIATWTHKNYICTSLTRVLKLCFLYNNQTFSGRYTLTVI